MSSQFKGILTQVVEHYLGSGNFNGLPVKSIANDDEQAAIVRELIASGELDLVRGDGHPNPHIKAFPAEPIATQLEKIDAEGFAGCLYPTPRVLEDFNAGASETAPYTKLLKLGSSQLDFRTFDLRALEWYRNDPRFDFDLDDIHGRVLQRAGTKIADRQVVRDNLEFLEFGFAYDDDMHRAIAVFIRYLHDLPPDQQVEMQLHELGAGYKLHPDFYRTQIIGDWPEKISIYDAFLQEKHHINEICYRIGKPPLFKTTYSDFKRPRGFGILLRPTLKEFRAFALQLDQLLSDDLNRDFFKGDVELNRRLTDEDGQVVVQAKGTIQLLESWLGKRFKPADPKELQEMYANFRAVRKIRQRPAHKAEEDNFDQVYLAEQRDVISRAFDAVRTLRMILENHPAAEGYEVPDYLRNGKVWTY